VPRYPAAARDSGLEGGIVVAVVVTADGRVDTTLTSFLYASAEPFEASVREAFALMRFEPVQVDGQPRCSLLVLPYVFELAAAGTQRSSSFVLGEVAMLAPNVVKPLPDEQRGMCPPLPVSTDGTPPVFLSCQVDRQAREIRSNAVLNWEPAAGEVNRNACFRVEIRFVVDTLGVPERGTAALISTNNAGFGAAFMALVPDLRFAPAQLKGRLVRQVVTFKPSLGVRTVLNSGEGIGSSTPSRRTRC